jgi:hypothetical protein
MSLQQQLEQDLRAAMLAQDDARKRTLRSALTACSNALVEKRADSGPSASLTDDEVLKVLAKQASQRRDSIAEFGKAGRADLVALEQEELNVLLGYLPQPLSHEEIEAIVKEVIAETGASRPADLGMVMRSAMLRLQGKGDGKTVNEIARGLLSSSA